MPSFGLIAEGPTDHIILENILVGYFNDPDLPMQIRPLQPLRDATNLLQGFGGWYNVFEYCKSTAFEGAFEQNDYLVVQIDTDCSNQENYDVPALIGETVEAFIERIVAKFEKIFLESFGGSFLEIYRSRILFAIAVDEIECWLLPLYYTNKTSMATNNCLYKLNQAIAKTKQATINPTNKEPRLYEKLSKEYCKRNVFKTSYLKNVSLKYFVEKQLSLIPTNPN